MKTKGRPDPMVADPREERLVSWAKGTIDSLRREVGKLRMVLNHQVNEHKGSEVVLRRYTGTNSALDRLPIKSGSHVEFLVQHPLFANQRVPVECWIEKGDRSLRKTGVLILNAHFGALKIVPSASNMVYVSLEDF